tara:strand:+ start:2643 stop:3290 length:648 start_codon:yes stop_codon:yes gene_type:complete
MTYLQLVNSVLRRLREEQVATVAQNSYSQLVGELVNEAKETVENSWDWTGLRTTIVISTVASTSTYTMTGSQNKIQILDVINDTGNTFMQRKSNSWMRNLFLNNSAPESQPQFYNLKALDDAGDNIFEVYPIPDKVYDLNFSVVKREGYLTEDTDKLKVPTNPVILLATALASRERGETGGTAAAEQFALADRALSDMIAYDAAQHPDETIWAAV